MERSKRDNFFIIFILGWLSTVSPLAIDMYLPAFQEMAADLNTTTARISISLSSYFIGLSFGQLVYGPLYDRFGRKIPLYFGLMLFIVASIGCLLSKSVNALIAFRFLQALGGCAAQVAAMTLVRDLFPPKDMSKVFSLITLVIGVSPLLAPTFGGFISWNFGWHAVFIALAGIVLAILLASIFYLPQGMPPDKSISLRPIPIVKEFFEILNNQQFFTYTIAGSFSFAGLFVYVAGSPIIFMEYFKVSSKVYTLIFALLSIGFIGSNQLNVFMSKKYSNDRLFGTALMVQVMSGILLVGFALAGILTLPITILLLLMNLSCFGFMGPNANTLSLMPFARNAGSASALLGFLQMGIGAACSAAVGLLDATSIIPIAGMLSGTSIIGLIVYLLGKRKMPRRA